ncbi:MAG: HDIG domain-containing protein [Actinomycetota bacterium]|nr:HDIG domain-containing protein [Actinomycetota bacterium]
MMSGNKKNKEVENGGRSRWRKFVDFAVRYFSFRSIIARRMYIFVLTLGMVTAILVYSYSPDIGIELGQPSPRTIKANRALEFEDPAKTEEDKNKNEAEEEDVYIYDINILNGEEGALYQIKYFYLLSGIVQKKDKPFEEKVDYMNNMLSGQYSSSVISLALNLSADNLNMLMEKTQDIAREIMKEEIKPTEVDIAKNEAINMAREEDEIKSEHVLIVTSVLENNISPTVVFDPAATEEARQEARINTPPHMVSILEGQTIVFEGEIVSEDDILILTKLGLLQEGFNWERLAYIFLISSAVLFLFGFYIFKFNPKIFNNTKKTVINAFLLVTFTALIRAFTILSSIHLNFWNYLFPIIAASLICTILFNTWLAMMMTICLGIFAGIATDFDFSLAVVYMLGGIFSTYMVSKVSQRSGVMRAGFFSSLVLAFLFLTVNLIGGEVQVITLYTLIGVLNGIICAVIAIGLLPFIESTFNVTTAMGLLELSNTDQPLLKKLLMTAPGTYNHSILVAHLAENAAKAIGADALLVKVAALYHDVGKMKRPEYFYENQASMGNVHDRLNPSMSRHIISNHIKDGLVLAAKNKIPKKVLNIISQHHGNSIIAYFYEKQKGREMASNGVSNGLKEHFRYPAKKPQSKEAAILMLADSTEAAVRSIEKITPKKIEQMVSDIFEDKLQDGQLDETDITLKEINKVRNTMIDGIMSIYHSRISYDETGTKTEKEMEPRAEAK